MVPDQPIGRMRGYVKGMKVRSLREKFPKAGRPRP
jgi:hypothetical protein